MSISADDIIHIWKAGGWVMIPLAILAYLIYTNVFTLFFYLFRTGLKGKNEEKWREWVKDPTKGFGRVQKIISYTQQNVKTAKQVRNRFDEVRLALTDMIDRKVRYLNTLVTAAPLLGLLGTVLGMLGTFLGIASSGGNETAGVIASGISEALVTTQTGLTIALPGIFMVMIIKRQKQNLEAKIARLESLTLTHFRFE